MSDIPIVQIEKIWRRMIRFKNGEVFRIQMFISRFAGQDGEQERQVRIVRIQQIQSAEIVPVVAGNGSEIRIELVVGLGEEIPIGAGEDPDDLRQRLVQQLFVSRIENHG